MLITFDLKSKNYQKILESLEAFSQNTRSNIPSEMTVTFNIYNYKNLIGNSCEIIMNDESVLIKESNHNPKMMEKYANNNLRNKNNN